MLSRQVIETNQVTKLMCIRYNTISIIMHQEYLNCFICFWDNNLFIYCLKIKFLIIQLRKRKLLLFVVMLSQLYFIKLFLWVYLIILNHCLIHEDKNKTKIPKGSTILVMRRRWIILFFFLSFRKWIILLDN